MHSQLPDRERDRSSPDGLVDVADARGESAHPQALHRFFIPLQSFGEVWIDSEVRELPTDRTIADGVHFKSAAHYFGRL